MTEGKTFTAGCLTVLGSLVLLIAVLVVIGLVGTGVFNNLSFAPEITYGDGIRVAILLSLAGILVRSGNETKVDIK